MLTLVECGKARVRMSLWQQFAITAFLRRPRAFGVLDEVAQRRFRFEPHRQVEADRVAAVLQQSLISRPKRARRGRGNSDAANSRQSLLELSIKPST